ncbi:MAG: hypothetical protein ACYC8T_02085 [Myxococcaceae bacterium]
MPKLIALLLFAAAPRIAVLPFSGPGANAARNQVVGALCESATCVPSAKVSSGPKPDWKKLKKEKVEYVVTGTVAKARNKKLSLELQVVKAPGKAKLKKSFPLDKKSKLSSVALDSASGAVLKTMGVSAAAKEPEPPPERPEPVKPVAVRPEPVAEQPEPPQPEAAPEKAADPWARSSTGSGSEVSSAVDEPYRPKRRDPLFVLQVGPDLFARRFGYSGVETRNLRSYSANLVVAPHFQAELYPLATLMRGLAAGFGIELGYSFGLGLQSRTCPPGGECGPSHPTSLTRLDAGAKLRAKLGEGGTAIVPGVGYRSANFVVGAAADGSTLDGLPSISYSALVLNLGLEVPAMDDKLVIVLRGAVMPVLSAGEITGPEYFPRGSALGFEVAAGVGYRITPAIEARVIGRLTSYGLTLRPEEGAERRATGASDLYFGGNLAVRYTY